MKKTACLCVLAAFFLMAASRDAPGPSRYEMVQELEVASSSEKEVLARKLSEEWAATQSALLRGLHSQDQETRCYSAYLLGLYRYPQAAPFLARVITLTDDVQHAPFRQWIWGKHPAVEALIGIGKPSIRPMLENLETSSDELVRRLSLDVIYFIEGSEPAKAVLEKAIADQPEAAKKEKLRAALVALTALPRK